MADAVSDYRMQALIKKKDFQEALGSWVFSLRCLDLFIKEYRNKYALYNKYSEKDE